MDPLTFMLVGICVAAGLLVASLFWLDRRTERRELRRKLLP